MSKYDNFLIAGSFNTEILETAMSNCCDLHGFIQDPTCYKNPNKPTCIDLIITNFPYLFTKTQNLETGLSDFHKLMFTVLKMHFEKPKPKIVVYRDHKNFSDERFCWELLWEIEKHLDCAFNNFYLALRKRSIRANQRILWIRN